MEIRIRNGLALVAACLMATLGFSQTVYQDAVNLAALSPQFATYKSATMDSVPAVGNRAAISPGAMTEIQAILGNSSGQQVQDTGLPQLNPVGGAQTNPVPPEGKTQAVVRELNLIEDYLDATAASRRLSKSDFESLAAAGIGHGLTYLDDIAARAAGTTPRTGIGTSGSFSSIIGISEAEILMGIVDWTIKRAKDELMQAFLGRWLDTLEEDSLLQVIFPSTLSLLRTSDITTAFSNGAVWKAAFKNDLDAVPGKVPQMVAMLIRRLPKGRLSERAQAEIIGASRVISLMFTKMGSGSTVENALIAVGSEISLAKPKAPSMVEKGTTLTSATLDALHVEENGVKSYLSPSTIVQMSGPEMEHFCNLMFLRAKSALDLVFKDGAHSVYLKVFDQLEKYRAIITQTAITFQSIKQLTSSGQPGGAEQRSKKLDAQEVERYFSLSMDLVDNSVKLLCMVDLIDNADSALYFGKVHPIAEDVLLGIQSVETQQYGQLITSLLDIVVRLDLVSAEKQEQILLVVAKTTAIKMDLDAIKNSNDTAKLAFVQKTAKDVEQLAASIKGLLPTSVQDSINGIVKRIQALAAKDVNDVKMLIKLVVDQFEKAKSELLADNGFASKLNRYGRFVVDLLLANSSDDVESIMDEFAAGESAYLVKQTSKSAFTATFLPGIGGGIEFLDTKRKGTEWKAPGTYFGASLPIGVEYSWGVRNCKIIGAFGIYGQVADLGALLNFRLTQTDTIEARPEVGFRQVFSPGLYVLLHGTKIPIVLGLGGAMTSQLRTVSPTGLPNFKAPSLHLGLTLGVDVTAFQFWASKRKINPSYLRLGQSPSASTGKKSTP